MSSNVDKQMVDEKEQQVSPPVDIFETVLNVLQKQTCERTAGDIDLLMKATESFEFFEELNTKKRFRENEVHKRCCKRLRHEELSAGSTVFKFGEVPDKFYIVLRGSVNVLIHKDADKLKTEIAESKRKYPLHYQKAMNLPNQSPNARGRVVVDDTAPIDQRRIVHLLNKEVNYENVTGGIEVSEFENVEDYFKDGVFMYNCVGNIGKGRIFGELGLIMKKPRAATIIAREDVHFGVMTKEDYQDILLLVETEKLQSKIQFFQKYLPKQIGIETITKFSYLFTKVQFGLGQTIFQQDEKPKMVYFIKVGEVLMHKTVAKFEDEPGEETKKQGKALDRVSILNIHSNKKAKPIQLPIQKISVGQFFGEEEVIHMQKARAYGTTCVSAKGSLFAASRDNFMKIVKQRSELYEFFTELAGARASWHTQQKDYLIDAAKTSQTTMQNLNQPTNKSSRISSNSVDVSYAKIMRHSSHPRIGYPGDSPHKETEASYPNRLSEPQPTKIEVEAPKPQTVTVLRKTIANSNSNSKLLSMIPQSLPCSPVSSVADSITKFERKVEVNTQQVKKVLASSHALGYTTFMDLRAAASVGKTGMTLSEIVAKKNAAQKKDPNRHFNSAWKGTNMYENLQATAHKMVYKYLDEDLGELEAETGHLKISALKSNKLQSASQATKNQPVESDRSAKRISSGRSTSTLSFKKSFSRPTTAATNFNSIRDFIREQSRDIHASTPVSPTVERDLTFSPKRLWNSIGDKGGGSTNMIEEAEASFSQHKPDVNRQRIERSVNAAFPKLVPKLPARTKSCSEEQSITPRRDDSNPGSFRELKLKSSKTTNENSIGSGLSSWKNFSEALTATHRPFYSTANVFHVKKMKKARAIVQSAKNK